MSTSLEFFEHLESMWLRTLKSWQLVQARATHAEPDAEDEVYQGWGGDGDAD